MSKQIRNYDLVVVGGGFAGTAAAICAARLKKKVLLLEQGGALGGAAVNNLVNPFMPNKMTETDGRNIQLSAGLFLEIVDELKKHSAISMSELVFDEEYLKLVLNRMTAASNVDILFHASVYDCTTEGDRVRSLLVQFNGKKYEIFSDFFADATGDGNLLLMAGCDMRLGRDADNLCQPMTMCFRVANIDKKLFWKERAGLQKLYRKFQEDGKIKNPREDILVFDNLNCGVLHFNTTRVVRRNPTDIFDITAAEIEAREQVFEMFEFLKSNSEAFKDSRVIMTSAQIGIRESRMLKGEYILTESDLKSNVIFPDSIAVGNYDLDIHNPEGSGTSHYYFKDQEHYSIPYRCLLPKEFTNLITAGRCISATHEAQSSIRIMPICCNTGEAAGYAVALCKDGILKNVDVKELQEVILKNGGLIS